MRARGVTADVVFMLVLLFSVAAPVLMRASAPPGLAQAGGSGTGGSETGDSDSPTGSEPSAEPTRGSGGTATRGTGDGETGGARPSGGGETGGADGGSGAQGDDRNGLSGGSSSNVTIGSSPDDDTNDSNGVPLTWAALAVALVVIAGIGYVIGRGRRGGGS